MNLVALTVFCQDLADNTLAFAAIIDIGGIDKVDPPLKCPVNDARRIAGGIDLDLRPMDSGSPFSSPVTRINEQSQPMRRDVSAETWGPSSICDVSAETCTTTW